MSFPMNTVQTTGLSGHNQNTGQGFDPNRDHQSSSVPHFDVIEWYPSAQSCERYLLDHAQYEFGVQSLAKFLNIKLPFQWPTNSVSGSQVPAPGKSLNFGVYVEGPKQISNTSIGPGSISLVPYIRRLVVTGWDKDPVLHGFFGDDWRRGVGPTIEIERRNYLFLAKSGGWSKCKEQYDMNPQETVPFLKPPDNVQAMEIETAEKQWSEWLLLEDWMVGDRRPPDANGSHLPGADA